MKAAEQSQAEVQPERLRALVLELTRLFDELDRHESACCGVTVAQCLTLTTLRELGEITSQGLGEALGLAPSTVTRSIAPLHARGWIVRRRDTDDRRQVRLALSKSGAAVAAELDERGRDMARQVLERVPEHERDQAVRGLELLLDACRAARITCCPPTESAAVRAAS